MLIQIFLQADFYQDFFSIKYRSFSSQFYLGKLFSLKISVEEAIHSLN